MDESFGAFCRRVQAIQESHGWKFAPGLTEAAMDAWQARIGFVFPPEMREMLSIGYPVAARKEQVRSVGPMQRSDGKIILRVRKRHIMIPQWLARRRPFREATYMHWSFVDWATTTVANVELVEELARGRQHELLRFQIQMNGAWPLEWGPRPEATSLEKREMGGEDLYDTELDRVIDERIGEVPPLVPLDSRTLVASSEQAGMPVFMYWFGEELHLHAFDLAGSLARAAGVFPPNMAVTPRWTFWSQFAEIGGLRGGFGGHPA